MVLAGCRRSRQPRSTSASRHGTAGIGHALFELFGATRDARFREAGERAFDYEQWWFERRSGTWPDLRGVARAAGWDAPSPAAGSWCHGAPGIALSRLRVEQLVSPGAKRRDADAGLAITQELALRLTSRVPDDFSLCHGAAGVADVLLYAAESRRGRPQDLFRLAADIGLLGIERYYLTGAGFPCGLPEGHTPGLFLGLAGMACSTCDWLIKASPLRSSSTRARRLTAPDRRPRVGVRPGSEVSP